MKTFLVINTSFFGDTLLTGPLCQNIKTAYPQARVIFIVNKPFYEAAAYMKGVDQVIGYDKNGRHRGVPGIWRFWRENKAKLPATIEASFVIYGNERGIILSRLFGAQHIYADNNGLLRCLLDNGRLDYRGYTKAQDRHCLLLECHTGKPFTELPMQYEPPAAAMSQMEAVWSGLGLDPSQAVAICTTTKNTEKDLHIDTCCCLLTRLKAQGFSPLLVGAGASAQDYAAVLNQRVPDAFTDLTDQTSIAQLGALLKRVAVLISVDTGTLHLGLSVGVPVVAVFYLNSEQHLATWAPKSVYRHRLVAGPDFSAEEIMKNLMLLHSQRGRNGAKLLQEE